MRLDRKTLVGRINSPPPFSFAAVFSFVLLLVTSAAAAPVSTLLWSQTEPDATYTSAAISLHGAGAAPTFATATSGLDTWPVMVEVYNMTDSGDFVWSYSAQNDNATGFSVASARHTEKAGVGAVDLVVVEGDKDVASDVWLRGFASLGSGRPAWSLRVSNCRLASGLAISDDGSAAALTTYLVDAASGQIYPQLLVVDGQSGALKVNVTRALGNPGGPVTLSETGAWVAWTQGDSVFVYDGASGDLRGEAVNMGWNTASSITDSGDELVFSGQDAAQAWSWNAADGVYEKTWQVVPPGPDQWFSESCAVSSNSKSGPLAVFGWTTFTGKQARVTIYEVKTGKLLSDYTSLPNQQLQTSANVRIDGDFVGVSLWGDQDDVPTAVLLQAGVKEPIFTFVTPGSMFAVDVAVGTGGGVFFSVAGKHVPANVMGKGGDAFTWLVNVTASE